MAAARLVVGTTTVVPQRSVTGVLPLVARPITLAAQNNGAALLVTQNAPSRALSQPDVRGYEAPAMKAVTM